MLLGGQCRALNYYSRGPNPAQIRGASRRVQVDTSGIWLQALSASLICSKLERFILHEIFQRTSFDGAMRKKEQKKRSVLEAGFEPAHPKITELKSAALDQLGHPSCILRFQRYLDEWSA